MRYLVFLLKKYLPSSIWFFISNSYVYIINRPSLYLKKILLKNKILEYYKSNTSLNKEEAEVIDYLKNNDLHVFPYNFNKNYNEDQIGVYRDPENGLYYCFLDTKRIYFKRAWSKLKIRRYFNFLLLEQDQSSPHCYMSSDFEIDNDSTILDIGGAEGIFTLKYIEKVKMAYIFEPDSEWLEALEATFRPFQAKIQIIKKFVGDNNNNTEVSIDEFCKNITVDFIKIDVDGAERKVLKGAKNTIKVGNQTKVAICTYHNQNDAKEFKEYFNNLGFNSHFSKGYMLFIFDKLFQAPFLRKGILRIYE